MPQLLCRNTGNGSGRIPPAALVHTADERRQLPPQAQPPQTDPAPRTLNSPPRRKRRGGVGPLSLRSRGPTPPQIPA
jgi:hypothetical protein